MNIENAICNAVIGVVKELYGQEVPAKMVQLQDGAGNRRGFGGEMHGCGRLQRGERLLEPCGCQGSLGRVTQ